MYLRSSARSTLAATRRRMPNPAAAARDDAARLLGLYLNARAVGDTLAAARIRGRLSPILAASGLRLQCI